MNEPWDIPSSWRWIKTGDIATIVGGGTPRTSDATNFEVGNIAWITPADLSSHTAKLIVRGTRNITTRGLQTSSARILPMGSVLLSSRAPIGYVAIAAQPLATNQGFKSFVLSDGIETNYVYYYLLGSKELIEALSSGTTFKELSGANAARIPFPLPPLLEQHRIVAEIEKHLTRLDASVTALKRAQSNLKRYRASVLKAACEGKLVPTEAGLAQAEGRDYEPGTALLERILTERRDRWESQEKRRGKYKEPGAPDTSDLPELPEGWVWATLAQVGMVESGQTPKGIVDVAHTANCGFPWYRVRDMNAQGNEIEMSTASSFIRESDASRLGLHLRPPGTIIFPKRGGAIATNKKRVLSVSAAYDLNTMGIIPMHELGPYLWWWFQTIDLGALGDGSNVPQINHDDIGGIALPVPPMAEQRRIVTEVERRLSVTQQAEDTVEANLKRAERLHHSILKRAFSGQLVPQYPNDEPASALLERIRAQQEASRTVMANNRKSRRPRFKPNPERQLLPPEQTP